MRFVTFIIPTIGRKSLIKSLEILWYQTDLEWKAIVVGDGLDEEKKNFVESLVFGSGDIITSLFIPKTGTKTNDKSNGQAGLVRNKAFRLVDTEWIAFLDDDDWLDKDYVRWLKEESFNMDLVIFRMRNFDGNILPPKGTTIPAVGLVGIAFAVRTSFIREKKIEFLNDGIEDFIFLSHCISNGARFKISDKLAYYVGLKLITQAKS